MLKPAHRLQCLALSRLRVIGLCVALDFVQMVDCVGASLRTNIFNENRYGTA